MTENEPSIQEQIENYEKQFYDVILWDGSVHCCWPNAGRFSDKFENDKIIHLVKCGNQSGYEPELCFAKVEKRKLGGQMVNSNVTLENLKQVWDYYKENRGAGHTTAMINGANNTRCILLVSDSRQRKNLIRSVAPHVQMYTVNEAKLGKLRGNRLPLLIEQHALVGMVDEIYSEVRAAVLMAERRLLERVLKGYKEATGVEEDVYISFLKAEIDRAQGVPKDA